MADFYSAWASSPNNGAKYRLHLAVTVAEQSVSANTTTYNWGVALEKDRSYRGFYWYTANWAASINGVTVLSGSGVGTHSKPDAEWPGWSGWPLGSGQITVNNNADGTLPSIAVAADYNGAHIGWSIGSVSLSGAFTSTPTIPRATTPTVTPSPASIGSTVTIALPAAVGTYVHDITWTCGTDNGTIATGVSGNQTWTVPDERSQYPGVALVPIVITVVTKTAGGTVLGSKQVTLFSKTPPPAPTITPVTPESSFDIRARLVTYTGPTDWSAKSQVPASQVQLVDSSSATATCSIALSKLNSVDFEDYSIVDVDVFDGEDWRFTNHRFVLSRVQGDDVDSTKVATYSGTEFVDYELGFAFSQVDYYWDGSTDHALPTTPGQMLAFMLNDAKARGWGPLIEFDFTGALTSLGEPWSNTAVSRTMMAGTSISSFLSGLVSDGLVEYKTEYHDNKAYLILLNPGTGQDFSADGSIPVVNMALAPLSSAPRQGDMSTQITAVTVAGDVPANATDPVRVTRTAAPFDADVFGRMEAWVAASGVADVTSLNAIGDNALTDNSNPTQQRTFAYNAKDASPSYFPYLVFEPGDWVQIPDFSTSDSNTIRDRINQITINKTVDSTTLTVVTGDLILSGTASIAKRQAAQTGGAIAGGNQTSPSQLDSRIPSAPTVSSITSAGYWTADGAAQSAVTVEWGAVGNALDGSAISVSLYEVWERTDGIDAEYQLAGTTSQTSIIIGSYDPLTILDFRVRAESAAGVYGEFSEDQTITMLAPPVSLPDGPDLADLYTDGVGSLYAVWGGTLGGTAPPPYLAYVSAEISTDGGATYSPIGTPIVAAGTIVINPNAYGYFFVRLRGYDRMGNSGTASSATEIVTVDPHVAPEVPTPPTTVTATAGAAWNASGILPTAWFDLAWVAPTLDLDGNAITIAGYDIFGMKSTETIERFLTSVSGNSARIAVGNGEVWTFRVRATSNFGGVSAESLAVTATANAAISVAAAPTAPTLSQYVGILQINWAGGGLLPQIAYAYAMISTTSGGTYTRAGGILHGAGEIDVPGLAPGNYYAKIVMVDELGNLSTSVASAVCALLPITGVTYQTSSLANTGIKITTGSLTAYDASGNSTFILNAATGEVYIAPYAAVFDLGAPGTIATTGATTTGIEISDQASAFNTFIHPSGVQIRNNQTPLSWWEADASDASLVNFFSPRAVIGTRLKVGDYEQLLEAKSTGSRLVTRYKGA